MFARAMRGIAPRSAGGGSWLRRLAVVSAIAMLAALMVALPSQALDGFESNDANLESITTVDWNDFDNYWNKTITATGATSSDGTDPVADFDQLTWVQDRRGNPDDIYGGGTKQDANCPSTKDGSLGGGDSKFDIDRLYLTHTKDGSGDDFLFLAWVRVPQNSTTASSHIAYEFNRGATACTVNQNGGPDLISRTAGDRLIVYDFEGGTATSTSPTLKLATWLTAGAGDSAADCETSSTLPCWGEVVPLTDTISDGAVNTVTIGAVTDEIANPDESLGAVRFGEAGINLSEIPGLDVCDFAGHVTGVARSSGSSGTAQMKDKVGPAEFELAGCVQATTISSLISLDDHATVNGFDADFVGDHTGDLTFSLYGPDDANCDGDDDTTGDPLSPVYTTTIEDLASGGPWSTADGDNSSSSYTVPANAEGVYNWVVEYSGDSANLPSSSDCGDESADVQYA